MLYNFIKRILFKLDPEHAHTITVKCLRIITGTLLEKLISQKLPSRPVHCMGLIFKNPLGLAAGFDKNAECINMFSSMGFGFVEVGTVTPNAQLGNDKPRIFRLKEAEGVINRMGFNNLGVDYLVKNIKKKQIDNILGINIGKNKNTPIEYSQDDYLICMEKVYAYAGYIAINISSPNTPNLRTLQYGTLLDNLLCVIKRKQKELEKHHSKYVPIVIKISPDLTIEELVKLADSLLRYKIDGVIACNTTINRSLVNELPYSKEIGGLSGRPVQLQSNAVIKYLSRELKGRLPIIGVGGVDSLIAAREKKMSGAVLIQIYSGLIYKGLNLIKEIVRYL